MYLEDIYVTPDFRGQDVGSQLLKAVAKVFGLINNHIRNVRLITKYLQEAVENDCHKLDFVVLNWNPAQEFYKKYGANDLTSKEQWHYYRFSEEELKKLASDCE